VGLRTVTNVCRECGEHAIVTGEGSSWTCPYCQKQNPFGRERPPGAPGDADR